jgi:NADPH:quinone reductase-like Zn-dependent oxidoreductase
MNMKGFIVKNYGKKEKLELMEIVEPVMGESDVLVQVYAASVNLLDSKIRNGEFKFILPYKPPFILGHDVAGVVVKAGSQVNAFKPGDEVYARPSDHRIGTFAEFISINEHDVAHKPKDISMEEAASIPLVGLTAYQALIEKADLKNGQKVFIQAGSGGVGTFAIQLAKHLGATVATTTGPNNKDLVKSLGADIVIDYKKDNFESIFHDYDVVLNSQNRKTLESSLHILRPGGKLISISGPPDVNFANQIGAKWFVKLIMKLISTGVKKKAERLGVNYSFLFMRSNGKQLSKITSLIDTGVIKPVVDKVFPFEQTNEAIATIEKDRSKGKVVIKIK